MQAGIAKKERLYRNSFHCINMIAKKEGIRGFYLGLGPNIVRSMGGALLLVAYDTFKVML
jgi:solute carrier family 25 (adenine nucleotide translocator) protein 4/5/6/31